MKCLIVEDDQMARASIELMCQKIDDLEVVGSFDNGLDALKMIPKTLPTTRPVKKNPQEEKKSLNITKKKKDEPNYRQSNCTVMNVT